LAVSLTGRFSFGGGRAKLLLSRALQGFRLGGSLALPKLVLLRADDLLAGAGAQRLQLFQWKVFGDEA